MVFVLLAGCCPAVIHQQGKEISGSGLLCPYLITKINCLIFKLARNQEHTCDREQWHSTSKLKQNNHRPLNYRGNWAFRANWNLFYCFLLFSSRSPVCDPLRKMLTPESPVADRVWQSGDQIRDFSPDILGPFSKAMPNHLHVQMPSNSG